MDINARQLCNRCDQPQPCGCYSDEAHLGLPYPSDDATIIAAMREHDRQLHHELNELRATLRRERQGLS